MAQYQSFPDASGDSRTLDKLHALKLPDLAGRSFLDVGCNEGFFCGFAKFSGAVRSVGVDHSRLFIERARQRFPSCEFHQSGWERLPEGQFDVILLASALHYADDQAALLDRLIGKLTPDGVLVLELGIASSRQSEWVQVQRGDDQRVFPSMQKLEEVLADYAWKWMGRSVSQDGDPVGRHVVHVSRRRPAAYLLMQPPAYGKSSIARRLFLPAGIPVLSGDEQIELIARGACEASERLRGIVRQDYSPFRIDQVVRRIFEEGAGEDLIGAWADKAGQQDFALDAYVPESQHAHVQSILAGLGYLPILLSWERVGPRLLPADAASERAEEYYLSMAAPGTPRPASRVTDEVVTGYVDRLALEGGSLVVRGWAVGANGQTPAKLGVRIGGQTRLISELKKQQRPDVQRHMKLDHSSVGFEFRIEAHEVLAAAHAVSGFQVFVPEAGTLRMVDRVVQWLAAHAGQQTTGM